MILKSFTMENWGCVGRVEIPNLSPGINILAAPNASGKSTLAEALKCTLLEYKFNSSKIKKHIPWGNPAATPRAVIEFAEDGAAYRLTKVFAKTKEGFSELLRISHSGQAETVAQRGDATEAVKNLTGMDSLKSGLPQLFWIPQGHMDLPAVDEDLGRSLRPMLGNILETARDQAVHKALLKRVAEWFKNSAFEKREFFDPAPGGAPSINRNSLKTGCALKTLEEKTLDVRSRLQEINHKFEELEKDINELDRLKHEHALENEGAARARAAVDALQERTRKVSAKQARLKELDVRMESASVELKRLRADLSEFEKHGADMDAAAAELESKRAEIGTAEQVAELCRARREQAQEDLARAEAARRALSGDLDLLEARREILRCAAEAAEIEKALKKAGAIQERAAEIKARLEALDVPAPDNAKKINTLLQERETLSAELKAADMKLAFEAEKDLRVELRIDGADAAPVDAAPGQPLSRAVRRRAELHIPGAGTVRIRRGGHTRDIEDLEQQMQSAVAALRGLLEPLKIDPALPHTQIIEEIQNRASSSNVLKKSLEDLKQEHEAAVPRGRNGLQARLRQVCNTEDGLRGRAPGLADWQPNREELQTLQEEYETRKRAADEEHTAAAREFEDADRASRNADAALNALRNQEIEIKSRVAAIQTMQQNLCDRHGSARALRELAGNRQTELETLERDHADSQLTDEEQGLARALEQERESLKSKSERAGDLWDRINIIEGRLQDTDGMHAQRNALEEALSAHTRNAAAEYANMVAHCTLLLHYEQIRDRDVEKSLKPVSGLLNAWLHALDAGAAKQVSFGPDLNPRAIRTRGGDMDKIGEATSFGEFEQIALLMRMAYGVAVAADARQAIILDDPLPNTDSFRLSRILPLIEEVAARNLQFIIFTCEPQRFDQLRNKQFFDLKNLITR